MAKRHVPPPSGSRIRVGATEDGPSLLELERFTSTSLRRWSAAAERLRRLQSALYFGLERLRQQRGAALVDAVRSRTRSGYGFVGWSRIVDFRYALSPLSVAGSLNSEGGRFNIGRRLSPEAFTPHPALYVAEDYPTAFLERFGAAPAASSGLSADDLALRSPSSFVQIRLKGTLEMVLDVGDLDALKPLVQVIKDFPMPADVLRFARALNLRRPPSLIRSPVTLQRQLLQSAWRMLPMQYDLPSNSQIFGRIAAGAGVHGILYPSAKDKARECLALFPQNWRGSESFIEVMDPAPEASSLVRLDGETTALE